MDGHCQEQGVNPNTAEESDVREFVDRNLHKADTWLPPSCPPCPCSTSGRPDYCETNPAEKVSLDDNDYNHIDPQTSQKVKVLQERGDTDDAVVAIPPEDVQKISNAPNR